MEVKEQTEDPTEICISLSFIPDDPVFKRKENDLYTDVTIDLYTAVLGGEVTVNTLDGQVKLKVRPGTQNDAKFV